MTLRNAFEELSTEATASDNAGLLRRIVALLMSPRGYDKSLGRQRGTVVVESGAVTTLGTVTTVSTVSNVGAGRDAGQMIVSPISRASWALNHRSRIS